MNILHVIDSGGLYGAEIMLLNLSREQQLAGHRPIIASIGELGLLQKPLEDAAEKNGISCQIFRMRPTYDVHGIMEILRCCRKKRIQIIHTHGYKGNILFGFLPKRVRKLPIISTVHGWTSSSGFSKLRFYEWLDGHSLRFLDGVVIVNRSMLSNSKVQRLDEGKVFIVDNGLPEAAIGDCPLDQDIARFCRKGFILGSVGRYSREKGFDVLLDAFHLLCQQGPQVKLLLIGEGNMRQELMLKAASLGVADKVFLTGYRENAARYMACLDVYVISSFTEGLPITLLEAMKSKTPVVATTVGGIPDVLEHNENALLVAPGDATQLAEAVKQVSEDPLAAEGRVEKAYEKFARRYSSKRMAQAYMNVYRQVCASMDAN